MTKQEIKRGNVQIAKYMGKLFTWFPPRYDQDLNLLMPVLNALYFGESEIYDVIIRPYTSIQIMCNGNSIIHKADKYKIGDNSFYIWKAINEYLNK